MFYHLCRWTGGDAGSLSSPPCRELCRLAAAAFTTCLLPRVVAEAFSRHIPPPAGHATSCPSGRFAVTTCNIRWAVLDGGDVWRCWHVAIPTRFTCHALAHFYLCRYYLYYTAWTFVEPTTTCCRSQFSPFRYAPHAFFSRLLRCSAASATAAGLLYLPLLLFFLLLFCCVHIFHLLSSFVHLLNNSYCLPASDIGMIVAGYIVFLCRLFYTLMCDVPCHATTTTQ